MAGDSMNGYGGIFMEQSKKYFSYFKYDFHDSTIFRYSTVISDNSGNIIFKKDSILAALASYNETIVTYDSSLISTYDHFGELLRRTHFDPIKEPFNSISLDGYVYYKYQRAFIIRKALGQSRSDTLISSDSINKFLKDPEGDYKIESFDVNDNYLVAVITESKKKPNESYLLKKNMRTSSTEIKKIKLVDSKQYCFKDPLIKMDTANGVFIISELAKGQEVLYRIQKNSQVKLIYSFSQNLNIFSYVIDRNSDFIICAADEAKRKIILPNHNANYAQWLYSWTSIYKLKLCN